MDNGTTNARDNNGIQNCNICLADHDSFLNLNRFLYKEANCYLNWYPLEMSTGTNPKELSGTYHTFAYEKAQFDQTSTGFFGTMIIFSMRRYT